MECKEQHSPDEEEMLIVLQELGLCFLNTWSAKHKATCTTGGSLSQIDFIALRFWQTDGQAKRAVHRSKHQALAPIGKVQGRQQ